MARSGFMADFRIRYTAASQSQHFATVYKRLQKEPYLSIDCAFAELNASVQNVAGLCRRIRSRLRYPTEGDIANFQCFKGSRMPLNFGTWS